MAGVLRHAGRALIKAVKRLAAAIEGWRQHRATYAELMSLDDRTLADIGIGRSDIPRIAAGQFLPQNWTPRDVRVEPTLAMPSNNNRPQIAA
ncbi:MAG: DUF1127 domain-containing protein [Rhodospirillales bacterium]|nr:DUF1127 domain-containing protein [Rhodospirillales bacterium]